MFALGCGPVGLPVLGRRNPGPAPTPAPSPTPGATAPDFSATGLTPAFAYHPHTATVTKDGSSQLTGVTGTLHGSPNLTPSATGPLEVTDAQGLKAWRFRSSEFLDVPNSFTGGTRAVTAFVVARAHSAGNSVNLFAFNHQADGVTAINTGGAIMRTFRATNEVARLRAATIIPTLNQQMVTGNSNKQLLGVAARTTANGGTRFTVGGYSENGAQLANNLTGLLGARLGGSKNLNGTENKFDLYYAVVFLGELSDAQVNAVRDLLNTHFALPTSYANNLVLEGDSITAGFVLPSGENVGMYLSEPGAGLIPTDVRVTNVAVNGAEMVSSPANNNLVGRRDTANAWPSLLLPGGAANNILVGHIGANDTASTGKIGETVYADIVSYINTVTTGVTARGWSVWWCANTAISAQTSFDRLVVLRGLLRSSLVTDTGALGVVGLDLIEDAGAKRFELNASISGSAYYADAVHPSVLGTRTIASGGSTPANGLQAVL